MSLKNNINETDYDEDLLAEKYIKMKGLSSDDCLKRRLPFASFEADNMIRLINHGLSYINSNISVECALDIGCGEGHLCRVLIQEKIAEYVVGVDKSKEMIKYATANSNDNITHYKYVIANAATDDLLTILGKTFPLIVQTHMLCHAEDINQLSKILSNIARVSCGIFVGLIPNPSCDFSSDSVRNLSKYGLKFIIIEGEKSIKDGIKCQVTFDQGTSNEITLIDHCYSEEIYERLFKQAGFKSFQWIPVQLDRNKDDAFLIDFVASNSVIGFMATMT